ncbi:MAG: flagellar biosynthetic protein FliR [Phycisphaerales bacterium]
MAWVQPLLPHVTPFLLVLSRLLGVFVFTPLLSSASMPRQVRVMIAVSFTAAVYPTIAARLAPIPELSLVVLAPLMLTEVMIGVVIGMIASLPLIMLQMGGYIMGYQMGLALAQAYNPELDTESGVMGQLLFFLGMAAFVTLGGFELVFLSLLRTFDSVPLGAFAADVMPLEIFVGLLDAGFGFALRIAAPVLAVVIMILVAMGFIMKTMPQINIMSVGFAMKIMAGISTLLAVIVVVNQVTGEEIERVLMLVAQWSASPGGG